MEILTYDLVRAEDLDLGEGAVEVRLQDQSVVTMHRINLSRLLTTIYVTLRASASLDGGLTLRASGIRPAGCRTWWVTLEVRETFGSSQGLTGLALGDDVRFDGWGYDIPGTAGTVSEQASYGGRGDMPVLSTQDDDVVLTALGGRFDGTGVAQICVHVSWVDYPDTPLPWTSGGGDSAGWPPATADMPGVVELGTIQEHLDGLRDDVACTPEGLQAKWNTLPGIQAASEDAAGIVELNTPAETVTGTDTTRATHAAGVKAALDARVPAGTPLSVARYASSGAALEASTVAIDASGNLGIGTATPAAQLHLSNGFTMMDRYGGSPSVIGRAAGGTLALPTALAADSSMLLLAGRGHDGTALGSGQRVSLQLFAAEAWTSSAQGTYVQAYTTANGGTTMTPKLRLDGAGNLSLGSNVGTATQRPGTGAQRVLAFNSGVAPTAAHPTDAIQAWVADRAGTAGKASLHVRTEDGTSHCFGDLSGIGTLCDATLGSGAAYQALTVKGSHLLVGQSSTQERPVALLASSFSVSTDATRQGRMVLSVYDSVAGREILRGDADGSNPRIGFLGATSVVRQTLAVAATDAATTQTLANSLRTALINLGLGA